MRQVSGRLFGLFRELDRETVLGKSGAHIDRYVRRYLQRHGLQSALVGYRGYPAHCSVSPNAVAVHGVPDARVLARGDVFTLDVAAFGGGWVSDAAWTYLTPGCSHLVVRRHAAAWSAFRELILSLKPGITLTEIARRAADGAARRGLSIIPDFVGHGIGRELHEPPVVSFSPATLTDAADGVVLHPGTVVNIEPVYSAGGTAVELQSDGWSYRTADGEATFHFELTVALRPEGPLVLQLDGDAERVLPEVVPFGNFGMRSVAPD